MAQGFYEDDGWNTNHHGIVELLDLLNLTKEMHYEIMNCIRGSYYSDYDLNNVEDLVEALLILSVKFKDVAEGIKG